MSTTFTPSENNKVSDLIHETPIKGLFYLAHKRFDDDRGFYAELSHVPEVESVVGMEFKVKQLNLSHSKSNVIRGFHAENWNKLLTVISGSCFCAWVDVRPDSPTFKEVVTMQMGEGENAHFGSMFISAGIGNSFCVTTGPLNYLYGVDQLYAERDTSGDVAISLFDPDIDIAWPIERSQMIVSERDLAAVTLKEKYG